MSSEPTTYANGDKTKLAILETGLRLWMVDPSYVTARRIADELGITHGAVLYHFASSLGLRNAIAVHAVKEGESRVIAHLITIKHRSIEAMPDADRLLHMQHAAAAR